jgi:hypothetical protein
VAYPTRTGVLEYRNSDGSIRREYRPPSEVFHADSLASLAGAPVTIGHPDDFVSPDSWNTLSKGHVGESVVPESNFVKATMNIQSRDAVDSVLKGQLRELSSAYTLTLDETPGVTPEGERYDAVQRDIRYNHVALLPVGAGRAGSEVRLRMDSAYVTFDREPMTETNATPVTPAPERTDAAAALVARADRLEGENATLRTELASLREAATRADSTLDARVAARLALIEQVRPFAGTAQVATLSERALLELGAGRTDGSDDFLRGCMAVRADGVTAAQNAAVAVRNVDSNEKPGKAEEARAAFLARNRGNV